MFVLGIESLERNLKTYLQDFDRVGRANMRSMFPHYGWLLVAVCI